MPPAFSCRVGLPCHRQRPLSSPRPGSRSGRLRHRPTPSFLGRPADWPALKSRLRGGRETGGVSIAAFLGLWLEISASDSSMTLSPTDPFIQQISTELEPGLGPGAAATEHSTGRRLGGCGRLCEGPARGGNRREERPLVGTYRRLVLCTSLRCFPVFPHHCSPKERAHPVTHSGVLRRLLLPGGPPPRLQPTGGHGERISAPPHPSPGRGRRGGGPCGAGEPGRNTFNASLNPHSSTNGENMMHEFKKLVQGVTAHTR